MGEKVRPCLVSCSVLKREPEELVKEGKLDADLVFVSKYFHVNYKLLERNIRRTVEKSLTYFHGDIILVYGDLCLGPNNEMKRLVQEYGVVKVDALNCVDCLLGGKGKVLEVDPNYDLLFLYLGMIDFFKHFKAKAQRENVDEEVINQLFSGLEGIIILDTLGEAAKYEKEVEKLNIGLKILETKVVGFDNF